MVEELNWQNLDVVEVLKSRYVDVLAFSDIEEYTIYEK